MPARIHDFYLLKTFFKVFLYAVLSFTLIYVTIDVFEKIDEFLDNEARLPVIAKYYVFVVPFILSYIVPVSLLLGTIFSMGILARRNELVAFISSGVSLVRIAAPILLVSFLISGIMAFFNDYVVSRANRKHKDIFRHEIEGRARTDPLHKENFHYLGEGGYVYLAKRYNHDTETLFEVVVQQFDRNTLIRRIDAKTGQYYEGTWIFESGFDRRFDGDAEDTKAFERIQLPQLKEEPEDFAKKEVDQENMTARELSSYIDKVRRSGGSVEQYLTDLYFKFSYPLAGSIFVLLGIALASGKRKQSMATGFGLTLAIAFTYYGVLRIGQTLGYNGVLPSFVAAELGNIIFGVIGVGLIMRANK